MSGMLFFMHVYLSIYILNMLCVNNICNNRDFIHSGKFLYSLALDNPHLQIIVSMDTGRAPLLIGTYLPDKMKQKAEEHIIEISDLTQYRIQTAIKNLIQRTGRHVSKKKWKNVETLNQSLQGRWYPGIWNKKISSNALIETHKHIPNETDYDHIGKRTFPQRNTNIFRQNRKQIRDKKRT